MSNEVNAHFLSHLVVDQLPRYVRSNFDSFPSDTKSKVAAFMEAYYEWLEQKNLPYGDLLRFPEYRNFETTIDKFEDYFWNQFMPSIPRNILADKGRLLKKIKEFYVAKGTEKSYKLLFRILYNENVEIDNDDPLIISDGNWKKPKSLRLENYNGRLSDLYGKDIVGLSSSATASITDAIRWNSYTNNIVEITLEPKSIIGSFEVNENLSIDGSNSDAFVSPIVTGLDFADTLTDRILAENFSLFPKSFSRGVNYRVGDPITFVGNGYDGYATVSEVSSGPIESIYAIESGTGYKVGDKVEDTNRYFEVEDYSNTFVAGESIIGSTSNATATVVYWDESNRKLWVKNLLGTFHTSEQNPAYAYENEFVTGSTSNANAVLKALYNTDGFGFYGQVDVVDENGNVIYVSVESSGDDYKFLPYIEIVSDTGSGANLIPYGSEIGQIKSINFEDYIGSSNGSGFGYDPYPVPIFPLSITEYDKKVSPYTSDELTEVAVNADGILLTDVLLEESDVDPTSGKTLSNAQYANIYISALFTTNTTANAYATVGTLVNAEGRFVTDRSLLNGYDKIRDMDYNSEFAYLIESQRMFEEYKDIVKKLVHPAGMQFSGIYTKLNTTELNSIDAESTIEISI